MPAKLKDYEDLDTLNLTPMKKPRKTLYDESWNDCCINSVEESDEDDVEMLDGNEVLAHWEEKVAKKQTNRFFPPE